MKKICVLLIALVTVLLGSQAVQACCFYNHSGQNAFVDGPDMYDSVFAGQHECTRGVGGQYKIYMNDRWGAIISNTIQIHVDDHGWLSIYEKQNNKWKVVTKDKNGTVQKVTYLDYKPAN